MPTIKGNYLIEVDGVGQCRAQEIEIGSAKHDPAKIYFGDQSNPEFSRAKDEVEEIKIKHAIGVGNAEIDFQNMYRNYVRGIDLTKPNVRVVSLDEDGVTTLREDNYTSCVPTSFQLDGKDASSKDIAMFTIGFQPEDHIVY
jgi:hypothetical protein